MRSVVAVALAAAALVTCGTPPPSGDADRVRVAMAPFLVYAPLYVARDSHHFEREGLDVEFVRLPFGAPSLAALSRGDVDVVPERPSVALLAAVAGGARLAAVADLNHVDAEGCVHTAILARRGLGDEELPAAELAGRRIELERAGIEEYVLDLALAPAGIDARALASVNLDDATLPAAFASGSVDLAFTSEPWLRRLVDEGVAAIWRPANAVAPDLQLAFLLFGPTLLDDRPEVGERFLAAYLRAVDELAAGLSADAEDRLAAVFGLSVERLRALCPTPVRRDGSLRPDGVAAFQSWAVARGLLAEPAPLDRLVDGRFAAAARRRLDAEPAR